MTTADQILNQSLDFSSLSAEVSFTLQDILLQPVDDDLLQITASQPNDYEGMFDDEEETEEQLQTLPLADNHADITDMPINQVNQKEEVPRWRRLSEMCIPELKDIQNMSFIVLKNVSALFEDSKNIGVGIPTTITATGSKFLALGTSLGNILLFQIGVKNHRVMGTQQQQKYGQVTSLSISRDNKYLAAGHESGLVAIWDLYYFKLVDQRITYKCKILKVLFCSEGGCQLLVNDIEGNLWLSTVEKLLWGVNIKNQKLVEKTESVYYDLKTMKLQSSREVVVLCNLDCVMMISLKPGVLPMHKINRPEGVYLSKIPNIEICKCIVSVAGNHKKKQIVDLLCVGWDKLIYIYRLNDRPNGIETLELLDFVDLGFMIYNIQAITEGVLVLLDNRQMFHTFRLEVEPELRLNLINEMELQDEVTYQRFLRGKGNRYLKSFNNTIISCSFNPKDKQLFFVCKSKIYRCRLHRWNEYISDLISRKQYLKALKICLEMYHRRLVIFSEPVQLTEKTVRIFNELGNNYLQERLKEIVKENQNRLRNIENGHRIELVEGELEETYDSLIEYMLQIDGSQYLFGTLYKRTIKDITKLEEYQLKFLSCLQPFIKKGMINRIPTLPLFREITGFYMQKGKLALIDTLIMSLEPGSLYYEDTVDMCTRNRLYRSLSYVCALNEDYISPANKMMRACQQAVQYGKDNALQTYYTMLKEYLFGLLTGRLAQKVIVSQEKFRIRNILLSAWLVCEETMVFFIVKDYSREDYFLILEQLVVHMLVDTPTQDTEYTVHEMISKLRNAGKNQPKCGRPFAEMLIRICNKLTLNDEELQSLLGQSLQLVTDQQLVNHLRFVQLYIVRLSQMDTKLVSSLLNKTSQLQYLSQVLQNRSEYNSSLPAAQDPASRILMGYMLSHLQLSVIDHNMQSLLKIDPQATMVYLLQRFSIKQVDDKIMTIKDLEYRYFTIRKLLKKLRTNNAAKPKMLEDKSSENSLQKSSQRQSSGKQSVRKQSPQMFGKTVMHFYVECLCRYKNQKRVYYEFTCYMQDYLEDTEGVLKIIAQYKLPACLGLFYKELGRLDQAYMKFAEVYRYYFFEENHRKLLAVQHCHGRFMRKMFDQMLAICLRIDNEAIWLRLLACVIGPLEETAGARKSLVIDDIQRVYEMKHNHPFLLQMSQILQQCLMQVSQRIPIADISRFIGEHTTLFGKTFVLNSFRTTISNYSKNAAVYMLGNETIVNEQVSTFEGICQRMTTGMAVGSTCSKCAKSVDTEDAIKVFQCSHMYHVGCLPRNEDHEHERCPQCITGEYGGTEGFIEPCFIDERQGNIFVTGMKTLYNVVNVIPTMLSVLPNPISVLSSKNNIEASGSTDTPPPPSLTEDDKQVQKTDNIYKHLAFQECLKQQCGEFNNFVHQYQGYLDRQVVETTTLLNQRIII